MIDYGFNDLFDCAYRKPRFIFNEQFIGYIGGNPEPLVQYSKELIRKNSNINIHHQFIEVKQRVGQILKDGTLHILARVDKFYNHGILMQEYSRVNREQHATGSSFQ